MKNKFKRGDVIRRTGSSQLGVKMGESYTMAGTLNFGSIRLEEFPEYSYRPRLFELVGEANYEIY